jgi:hypothetical protein
VLERHHIFYYRNMNNCTIANEFSKTPAIYEMKNACLWMDLISMINIPPVQIYKKEKNII